MVLKILLHLSTCILGIFCGTQLAEVALILPYWKGLPADEFFLFYKTFGQKIHQFYAPLTIVATILPIATLIYNLFDKSKTDFLMWVMTGFTVLFFLTYFLYFKEANTSFADRIISDEALPDELVKWGRWHWGRIVCEATAFLCGLTLLLKMK